MCKPACLQCDKALEVAPGNPRGKKYCSAACCAKHKRTLGKTKKHKAGPCLKCGKDFYTDSSNLKKGAKFCSKRCAAKHLGDSRRKPVQVMLSRCPICSNTFRVFRGSKYCGSCKDKAEKLRYSTCTDWLRHILSAEVKCSWCSVSFSRVYGNKKQCCCEECARQLGLSKKREIKKKWKAEGRYLSGAKRLRARTPTWLTREDRLAMGQIYKTARELSTKHGEQYHVDHIVPLNGELVSGLHVPTSLQVLTAAENLSKSNVYRDMGLK